MPNVTTADDFRSRSNIPTSVVDSVLEAILDGAEASAELYLGYPLLGSTFVDYLDGDGTQLLVLPRKYVTSVSSVYEDTSGRYGANADGFGSNTEKVEGTDWSLQIKGPDKTGVLVRYNGIWPYQRFRGYRKLADSKVPARGAIEVTYTTSNVTQDVIEAIYLEAIARYGTRTTGVGMQTSSSLDARSISVTPIARRTSDGITSPFLSPAAEIILAARKRKAVY